MRDRDACLLQGMLMDDGMEIFIWCVELEVFFSPLRWDKMDGKTVYIQRPLRSNPLSYCIFQPCNAYIVTWDLVHALTYCCGSSGIIGKVLIE